MNLKQFSLEGKVAIVTGSGRGIGQGIALGLADAGANVVVTARTVSDIDATASEIRAKGVKALAVPADVRISEQIKHLADMTTNEFGTIDILVNNAGGAFKADTMEMSERGWDAIIRENLTSIFLCTQEVSKVMIAHGKGSIINISSIIAFESFPYNAAYAASKAGIINLTKTLAVELAKHDIRVNAIAPGYTATANVNQEVQAQQDFVAKIPQGRLAQPEDIVGGVIYLASDASLYVTGATIVIDGGLTARPSLKMS
jgi:2-deoxy-D-gluconate 3-dehydrogenase